MLLLVLSVASALTNLLFVVLAALLVLRAGARPAGAVGRGRRRRCSICIGRSRWATNADDLEIGYFVWVCSFALLALAAFLAVGRRVVRSNRRIA